MSRPVVYVTLQQFCERDARPREALAQAGCSVRQNAAGRRPRREELVEWLRDADAVIAGVEPYDAELLARLPRLRCISRCGVGTDSIDLEAARRRQIAVFTTPDEVIRPVAELAVGMIFALARNFPQHLSDLRAGRWTKRTGVLLSEWTVGLVGFGRIGRAVAEALRPFGPRLIAHDPALRASEVPAFVQLRELEALLAQADLVSLHAGRRPQEGPLIGRRELALMKPGSFLVNTSRGFLVDEPALCEALESGRVAGAALDVFESEPYNGPLARLPQVLCTPHVASLTGASRAAMELRAAEQVVGFFAQGRTVNPVNADR